MGGKWLSRILARSEYQIPGDFTGVDRERLEDIAVLLDWLDNNPGMDHLVEKTHGWSLPDVLRAFHPQNGNSALMGAVLEGVKQARKQGWEEYLSSVRQNGGGKLR